MTIIPDLVRGREPGAETAFRHRLAATPWALAPLRVRLREWLTDVGLHEDLVHTTVLSVSEAAANSIEHGLRFDERGTVTVVGAVRADGLVELTIGDDGAWRRPRELDHRGYGLRIIHAVMDDVGIEAERNGTVVRMGLRPRGSARTRQPRPA